MPRPKTEKGVRIVTTIKLETYKKVEKRVKEGDFRNISEYIRHLIRTDLRNLNTQ
mgnify:CR=1 FL=1